MRIAILFLAALAPLLGACGAQEPAAPAPVRWMEAKPSPVIDSLQAAVVERPAPDRVVLEARWGASAINGACGVDLGLPAGVLIVEGEEQLIIDPRNDEHRARWVLEFPRDGRTLDAVVRYCVQTDEGMRAAQCAVRLTDG